MKTEIIDVSGLTDEVWRKARDRRDREALETAGGALLKIYRAAEILKKGGLVVFPTETVYGIGANAFDEEAIRRIYQAKGRPIDNPMIVHIARASDTGLLAESLPPAFVKLADAFWPGSLTMVLKKRAEVPGCVTGGLDTVGIRMPDSPVALELIKLAGTPVAAPSANLSGGPSPTKAAHVIQDLDGKVDLILAGPDCRVGIESTVVDMTVSPPGILRPGFITKEDIEGVLGTPVELHHSLLKTKMEPKGDERSDSSVLQRSGSDVPPGAEAPRSPGMKYRHYAPRAKMLVVEGTRARVCAEIGRLKALNEGLGQSVGVLLFEERDYIKAAHDFYSELRDLDERGVDLIIAGALPETDGVGFAVMNRMLKAAGYNVVRV